MHLSDSTVTSAAVCVPHSSTRWWTFATQACWAHPRSSASALRPPSLLRGSLTQLTLRWAPSLGLDTGCVCNSRGQPKKMDLPMATGLVTRIGQQVVINIVMQSRSFTHILALSGTQQMCGQDREQRVSQPVAHCSRHGGCSTTCVPARQRRGLSM